MEQENIKKRFWSKANKQGPDDCWEWSGYKTYGYGMLRIGRHRHIRAHRLSWILHFGNIPQGLDVCHKCDNRKCVNPNHLFVGTRKDNMQDAINKGRFIHGEKCCGAKLTDEKVREMRRLRLIGQSYRSLALKYGVSRQTATDAIVGVAWKHVN